MSKVIPLHIADQAVAACEAEIQTLREKVETLDKIIRRERELMADVQVENLILRKQLNQLTDAITLGAIVPDAREVLP